MKQETAINVKLFHWTELKTLLERFVFYFDLKRNNTIFIQSYPTREKT